MFDVLDHAVFVAAVSVELAAVFGDLLHRFAEEIFDVEFAIADFANVTSGSLRMFFRKASFGLVKTLFAKAPVAKLTEFDVFVCSIFRPTAVALCGLVVHVDTQKLVLIVTRLSQAEDGIIVSIFKRENLVANLNVERLRFELHFPYQVGTLILKLVRLVFVVIVDLQVLDSLLKKLEKLQIIYKGLLKFFKNLNLS